VSGEAVASIAPPEVRAAPGADRDVLREAADAYRATGSREAFEAFARALYPMARRFAAARFPYDAEARDDAVQEAFVRFASALRRWRGASIASFSFGVLHRACAQARRDKAREAAIAERAVRLGANGVEGTYAGGAEDAAVAGDRAEALMAALSVLDARSRTALYLKDAEDASIAEIAQALSLREGTVKSLLSRARAKVRARLTEAGYGE
jgi:RNA polymerase sigma-70 factor (ECF subfamily)